MLTPRWRAAVQFPQECTTDRVRPSLLSKDQEVQQERPRHRLLGKTLPKPGLCRVFRFVTYIDIYLRFELEVKRKKARLNWLVLEIASCPVRSHLNRSLERSGKDCPYSRDLAKID